MIILVDQEKVKLELYIKDISQDLRVVSLNYELSKFLVNSGETRRSMALKEFLEAEIRKESSGPLIFKDIDILFEPSLELDPLYLLKQLSRYNQLIVLWTGSYSNGVLSYGSPVHNHYRHWNNLDDITIKGVNDAL